MAVREFSGVLDTPKVREFTGTLDKPKVREFSGVLDNEVSEKNTSIIAIDKNGNSLLDVEKAKASLNDFGKPTPAESNLSLFKQNELDKNIGSALNKLFGRGSVMDNVDLSTIPQSTPKEVERNQRIFQNVISQNRQAQTSTLKPGAKVVDGVPGALEIMGRQGYAGIGDTEAGLARMLGDAFSSHALNNAADALQRRADEVRGGAVWRGTPVEGFSKESPVQELPQAAINAGSSILQTAPAIVAGSVVPGSTLPVIFGQTFAQEYNEGAKAGLNPLGRVVRAIPQAGLEVGGEMLGGADKLANALSKAGSRNGLFNLGAQIAASGVREIPGEEFTTTGNFIVDKLPGVGLAQDATFQDYLKAVKDTALATAIQSGGMVAGGRTLQRLAGHGGNVPIVGDTNPMPTPTPQPQQPAQESTTKAPNYDNIVSAINETQAQDKPLKFVPINTTEKGAENGLQGQETSQEVNAPQAQAENGDNNILQNRDRSNPSSIAQMTNIAANPDYGRLSFSRDFANGAPVVSGGTIAADQLGASDVAIASDGRRIPIQYAVVEAKDLLSSNNVDGSVNAAYDDNKVNAIRAIAGNGRVAGLQSAYANGTAANYLTEMSGDTLHGVNAQVIGRMNAPILVRVMPKEFVTADIGDVSNTTGNLELSSVEQANNDAQRVNLDGLTFAEDGSVNAQTVKQFVQAMPQAEQGSLIDTNGQPTRQAIDRINAAIFAKAYGNNHLVRLYAQAQDPEARLVLSALAQVAPKMARLEGAGTLDIRPIVADAAQIAVNARRNGMTIAQAASQTDLNSDPNVVAVLDLFAANPRSNKAAIDALGRAADFAYNEANKPSNDLLGSVERATRQDVINVLRGQHESTITQGMGNQGGSQPIQENALRTAAGRPGQENAGNTQADRTEQTSQAAGEERGLALTGQTNQEINDGIAAREAEEKAKRDQEKADAEAKIEEERKARQGIAADSFELTPTGATAQETKANDIKQADNQFAGQNDMFASPSANQSTEALSNNPPAQNISDFGEKLEGAKKDLWQSYKKAMSEPIPEDNAAITLAKYFPEPDYENLIAAGLDIKAIAAIKAMRDEIPNKPRMAYKLASWARQVRSLREFANALINGETSFAVIESMMHEHVALKQFAERIVMYAELGYPAFKQAKGYDIGYGWKKPSNPTKTYYGLTNPQNRTDIFDTREEAMTALRKKLEVAPEKTGKSIKLDIYKWTKTGEIVIGKKVASGKYIDLQGGFKDWKAAREYLREHEAELLQKLEEKKHIKPERRGINEPRVGEDYRKGEDVTPEKFAAEFGFRGVQFGNYVEQIKRQQDLNNAYDALLDLSHILNIPPRAISLDGALGLAFGARGSGGKNPAMAHYEREGIVINLTKMNGAGSLGHEWFHAMDNYFSRMRNEGDSYLTSHPRVLMLKSGGMYAEDKSVRKEVIGAFADVMSAIKKTDMVKRSRELDKTRTKDYWSSDLEMAARAFESYLIAKAEENGASNDYLSNIVGQEAYGEDYPYPTADEQKTINPAFDKLFSVIQHKETENGNVALFSRSESTKSKYDERIDELFNGGKANREGVKVLDKSDLLDMLGYGKLPVVLVESKVIAGQTNHNLTAEHWKNIPEWLSSPAAVFYSDTVPGSLVFIAPESYKGAPIRMIINPNVKENNIEVHLLANSYNAQLKAPTARWIRDGLLRYIDKAKSREFLATSGLQLPRVLQEARSSGGKVSTDSDLVKYRSENSIDDGDKPSFKKGAFFSLGTGSILKLNKSESQVSARRLNAALAKYFNSQKWSDAFETVDVPDALSTFANEVKTAFGTDVRYVAPTSEKYNVFLGVQIPSIPNSIFVNATSQVNITTIAGHEIYHVIERNRPDLHAWFKSQAEKYLQNFSEYHDRLNSLTQDGEKKYSSEEAKTELLADFTGDAISDPDFLQQLANDDADKFSGFLKAVVNFISNAITKLKNLGSSKYISEVELLRDDLRKVLKAFNSGNDISEALDDIPRFSRQAEANDTNKENDKKGIFGRDAMGKVKFNLGEAGFRLLDEKMTPLLNLFHLHTATPELRSQLREMKATIEDARRKSAKVAGEMQNMSEEERVMISDIIEGMVKPGFVPPEHALRVADAINQTMNHQTDELIELGMLSKETADRWRGKYLPRFYNRSTELGLDETGGVTKGVKNAFVQGHPVARGIGGGSLKGRGVYEEVTPEEIEKFIKMGWEVRDDFWKYQQGKLELKDESAPKIAQEKVTIWRDWTPQERQDMGEIRDSLYRFVMGYNRMQGDIALGRLFNHIANNQEWVRKNQSDGYVHVPDTTISGTNGVKRYGNLAGLWVRKDIFDHIAERAEEVPEALKIYREALGLWKEGKTALNPVAHFNNVIGNFSMAHFAGVSYWDYQAYGNALRDLLKGEDHPQVAEAMKAGLFTGSFTKEELANSLPPELKELVVKSDGKAREYGRKFMNAISLWLRSPLSSAYEMEDQFFKYLIYRKARQGGMTPQEATDYALRYIFTYDDLPKGARIVRDTAIPFFAWTYKVIPALLHTAAVYPWRLAAPAAVLYGINAIFYTMAAMDDDDDWLEAYRKGKELEKRERSVMPDRTKGYGALGNQKTIRLGYDNVTGNPVFLDASRLIPGGDLFDFTNQSGGVPVPGPLSPSHPILSTFSAMFLNKDSWSGKDITDINDTAEEAAKKRAQWMLANYLPAISPGGYHSQRAADAIANAADITLNLGFGEFTGIGKDGQPVQPGYAAMQTVGIKAKPYDLEYESEMRNAEARKIEKSIMAEVRSLWRLESRGAVSEEKAQQMTDKAVEKRDRLRLEKEAGD